MAWKLESGGIRGHVPQVVAEGQPTLGPMSYDSFAIVG